MSQCFIDKHSTHQVKILQTKSTYGFLLKVGDGFVFLLGSTATPLQVMERGTAEVLKECLQRNAAVSPWIQAFRWRCRASCTDKAGYNLKADSSIARDRGNQWAALHTDCEVHCTSTCFQKTYEGLLPDQVSGLICCACP